MLLTHLRFAKTCNSYSRVECMYVCHLKDKCDTKRGTLKFVILMMTTKCEMMLAVCILLTSTCVLAYSVVRSSDTLCDLEFSDDAMLS